MDEEFFYCNSYIDECRVNLWGLGNGSRGTQLQTAWMYIPGNRFECEKKIVLIEEHVVTCDDDQLKFLDMARRLVQCPRLRRSAQKKIIKQ